MKKKIKFRKSTRHFTGCTANISILNNYYTSYYINIGTSDCSTRVYISHINFYKQLHSNIVDHIKNELLLTIGFP